MPDATKCLNIRAAAVMANVSDGAIRAAIDRGELAAVHTAGSPCSRLIPLHDVALWIEAGKQGKRKRGRPANRSLNSTPR